MLELGNRQNMTGMETKRARTKCIANALVCSDVTTDPTDPAMRGARGPWGGPKIMALLFSLKISESKCGRALR